MKMLKPGVRIYDVVREFPQGRQHIALFSEMDNALRFVLEQEEPDEYAIRTRTLDEVPARTT